MTYEELLEENKRLKELVNRQTDALAMNCAKLILEAERYIEEHTKKEDDSADWWKK